MMPLQASSVLRRAVPGVPFILSLALSLCTVGTHPFWQDSGLYLTAVKDLGVLYPPGFFLYEILCFAWTKLLFFVDFTLAVHLFSSVCAALACGVMAEATRDFLKTRGPVFRVTDEDPGTLADGAALLAGVLMAGGFTLGSTAIYAKVYAFYYLILSLLLWRMIRADESGRPRDFTIVAALIGLAWQAHPSALLIGAALIAFVGSRARALGWKGVAGRIGVAAACALGPSLLLLPILLAREPWLTFGRPQTVAEFLRYVAGIRYLDDRGTFGIDEARVLSFMRYLWEDLLGVGLILTALGLVHLARRNGKLLCSLLLWVIPYSVTTILFKIEGQHDCWFVAARLPLFLALGLGAWRAGVWIGRKAPAWIAAAGVIGTAWAGIANTSQISLRNYGLAEDYGRILLGTVDRDAIVILSGDDSNGLASYLQRVKGERTDVVLVTSSFLDSGAVSGNAWYDDPLFRRNPSLERPDYGAHRERFPGADRKVTATSAFINANAGKGRAVFCEFAVPLEMLRPDLAMMPAGVYWKTVPRGGKTAPDLRYWGFPIEPENIRPLYRRARGQQVRQTPDGVSVKPEPYERRLALLILKARLRLALALMEHGGYAQAAKLCQSIIDFDDEEFSNNPEVIHLLGISYYAAGQPERAEAALQHSAQFNPRKENRATALMYLGEIAKKKGDLQTAERYFSQALAIPGLDPAFIRKLEEYRKR